MGKQFVTHATRVVSTAHCHNLREQNRDLQSLQTSVAARGCAEEISSVSMARFTLGAVQNFGGS
jgi:hypothetical protein